MKITKIRKRDGRVVDFDREKITTAIFRAAVAVGGQDRNTAESLSEQVAQMLGSQIKENEIPEVEQVQDIVEKVLIENGHAKTAKAYILYREQHRKMRDMKSMLLNADDIVGEYIRQIDWRVKENANAAYSFSGLLFHSAGSVMAYYILNEIYPKEISKAHISGDFHLHDLSMSMAAYCAGWSLRQLLYEGFNGVPGKIYSLPPKHLDTAVGQMVNFIGTLQNEWAGAQAFSSFDTYLAPYVRHDKLNYKKTKQAVQTFIYNMNIASRWGGQTPFSNITLDWMVPDDMKDQQVVIGGKLLKDTYSDYQHEMDMINKAFLEVLMEGDGRGRVFTFPIPTYNITRDFEWDSENTELLFEMTSKFGLPYFQNFVNSSLKPSDVRSMCCRLQLDLNQLRNKTGGLFGSGESSITGDTRILIKKGNNWRYEPIEKIYKTNENSFKTISFDRKTKQVVESIVTDCVCHGEKDVFEIQTNKGRIKLTEDHCMFAFDDDGNIIDVNIKDLRHLGYFISPKKLDALNPYTSLNVVDNLIKSNYNDPRAFVIIDEETFDDIAYSELFETFIKENYKKSVADIRSNWRHSHFGDPAIPFNFFKILYANNIIKEDQLDNFSLAKIKHRLPLKIAMNYKFGKLAGMFIAEGSMHEACMACGHDSGILKEIAELATEILAEPAFYDVTRANGQITKTGCVTYNSDFVRAYLCCGLGLKGHSNTKTIPEYIKFAHTDVLQGVIDGFYLGDGYIDNDGIQLTTTSYGLVQDFMLILRRLGVNFFIKERTPANENHRKSFSICITNYDGKLVRIMPERGQQTRHFFGLFKKGVSELKKHITKSTDMLNIGLSTSFWNCRYPITSETFKKNLLILRNFGLSNKYFELMNTLLENFDVIRIKTIKKIGREKVYDLSVPYYENFVAGEGVFFTHNTGSIGVVTLNMPRIGFLSKDENDFFERVDRFMYLAKESLELKRKIVSRNMDNGLLPYSKRYLGTLDNHFSTIGLVGMNEACLNFLEKNIATQEGKSLAVKVLKFMREKLTDYQNETSHIYNLEATPAEGVSYRLARLDRQKYPKIVAAGNGIPFYTNSTHLPVDYTDDIFVALGHQDELQKMYTGGTVLHGFIGERIDDINATKSLVKKISHNFTLPYFTITPTFSICPSHGYLSGEQHTCPQCGKPAEVYSRVVGYYRPVQNWNEGKQMEFSKRKMYSVEKSLAHKQIPYRL
ncbi:MAG: ribonucleoside triphosphate reductase [Candidatus Aenigmarchaeota archaeon]|nr:ribonucleoside triphosphate reductase [Candidatus Aenigmarchaeota archaeon]